MSKIINIYCDESCHLQDTGNDPVMVLGGVYCESDQVKIVSEKIRTIKKTMGFPAFLRQSGQKYPIQK